MMNRHFKILTVIIILLSLIIIFTFSFATNLQETNRIENISNFNKYFFPLNSFSELYYLSRSIQFLPIKQFINLYNYSIEEVHYSKNIFLNNEKITANLSLSNRTSESKKLWVGYTLKNPVGEFLNFPGQEVLLDAKDRTFIDMTINRNAFSNNSFISGDYDIIFALWDRNPALEGAQRINYYKKEKIIKIYSTIETFTSLDPNNWFSREGILGRSLLTPENVFIKDHLLMIRLINNSYSGGEIRSLEKVHYGSYEISMLLPDAPTSITGFFLYKAPDYYHEIDIEIFNKKNTDILFTTYADGDVRNNTNFPIGFDPTSTFNTYRIDYYPHEVSFYINDQLIEKFTDGFSKESMYLMVNTWYPNWLDGIQQKNDQYLKIQWIRY